MIPLEARAFELWWDWRIQVDLTSIASPSLEDEETLFGLFQGE